MDAEEQIPIVNREDFDTGPTTDVHAPTAAAENRQDPFSTSSLATTREASGSNNEKQEESLQQVLSKNQQKKRQRWERKQDIKRRRKEQDKAARHAKARADGRNLVQDQKAASGRQRVYKRHQWETHKAPLLDTTFQVCIDCAFNSAMTAKEINSLALQIRYCYSRNKRNAHPCRLAATGVATGSLLRQHLEKVDGHAEWDQWGFTMASQSMEAYYSDPQQRQSMVYLTSDADTVLTHLDASKIYIIGGIVDRNRLRRAAIDRAEGLGLATARLPIEEHLQALQTTRVLTCNHVFELLLHARNGDWKDALLQVLPQRKGAQAKESTEGEAAAATTTESSPPAAEKKDAEEPIGPHVREGHTV